jgi:hypothetical protein
MVFVCLGLFFCKYYAQICGQHMDISGGTIHNNPTQMIFLQGSFGTQCLMTWIQA